MLTPTIPRGQAKAPIVNGAATRLLVLVGPSGVGKTTLANRIVRSFPGFARLVTATTRPPRTGEVDGVDYLFMTEAQFDARLARDDFLEWARVHGQHRYGTPREAVVEHLSRTSLVGILDIQGVQSLRRAAARDPRLLGRLIEVFLAADSIATLELRLQGRGNMSPEDLARRMESARRELAAQSLFPNVIQSGTPDQDFARLASLIPGASVQDRPI